MTIRLSTGARNGLLLGLGFAGMFNRGYMKIFSGSQPANADAAETGTNLGIVSSSSLTLTKETRATGSITITGASGGSINNITVGGLNIIPDGAITVSGDTTTTLATKLATAINRNGIMEASSSGAVVTISGRPGTGVTTAAVAGSLTTATATYVNMGSGVAGVAPVNGLLFGDPVAGVIAKDANQIWSFTGINGTGTAGWFRLYGSNTNDSGAIISAAPYYPRLDGSVGLSGADLILSNISIATGSPNTIDTFTFTMPAS